MCDRDHHQNNRDSNNINNGISMVNWMDVDGNTALHIASDRRMDSVVRLLLEHGANPNLRNLSMGFTPLHMAVRRKSEAIVSLLVEHHADPLLEDKRGQSVVALAGKMRKDSGIYMLLEVAAMTSRAKRSVVGIYSNQNESGIVPISPSDALRSLSSIHDNITNGIMMTSSSAADSLAGSRPPSSNSGGGSSQRIRQRDTVTGLRSSMPLPSSSSSSSCSSSSSAHPNGKFVIMSTAQELTSPVPGACRGRHSGAGDAEYDGRAQVTQCDGIGAIGVTPPEVQRLRGQHDASLVLSPEEDMTTSTTMMTTMMMTAKGKESSARKALFSDSLALTDLIDDHPHASAASSSSAQAQHDDSSMSMGMSMSSPMHFKTPARSARLPSNVMDLSLHSVLQSPAPDDDEAVDRAQLLYIDTFATPRVQ